MSSITFKARKKTRDHSDQNKQSMNLSEVRMWLLLKGSPYNFRRQKTLGNFIVDFASLKQKIVIEVDGITHEEKKNIMKDAKTTSQVMASKYSNLFDSFDFLMIGCTSMCGKKFENWKEVITLF